MTVDHTRAGHAESYGDYDSSSEGNHQTDNDHCQVNEYCERYAAEEME